MFNDGDEGGTFYCDAMVNLDGNAMVDGYFDAMVNFDLDYNAVVYFDGDAMVNFYGDAVGNENKWRLLEMGREMSSCIKRKT